ncbi:MAG: NAD(P)H-hydrate dehydratase [Armatimonadota bacterium]|nr:NAD(P)H-hydrate dehydratase [Armatimonadota bacterium]
MKIVTAAEMADLEASCNLSEEQLAENAGYRVAVAIDHLEPTNPVMVLCGPGNNGADGLIAAFYLASEFAIDAQVILAADPEGLRPLGRKAYRRLAETDVTIFVAGSKKYERALERLGQDEILVDCLLGTGQKGPPRGEVAKIMDALGGHKRTVAVDVPTGIDSDTGEILGAHAAPFLTLCLGYPKRYLFTGESRKYAIHWKLVPIGIPDDFEKHANRPELIGQEIESLLPERVAFSNKRSSIVLSVAGSRQYSGAAALVASAAMRMGAGMVVAAGPPDGLVAVRQRIVEAPIAEVPSYDGEITGDAAVVLQPWLLQADAVVLGPGLGRSSGAGDAVESLLSTDIVTRWVVDGDALHHVTERGLTDWQGGSVLTPHSGEAARLLGTTAEEVDRDRFGSASELARKFNQVVVLKGMHPIVATADGELTVVATGTPLLASAGTGDVLAGMIGALLAQGVKPANAASLGTCIHGYLAEITSVRMGRRTYGVLASELAEEIPVVVALMREGGLCPKCLELLAPNIQEDEYEEEQP